MSAATAAGALLIALPVAFNVLFALLAARFDYPDVLRRPTAEVLARFCAGGTSLVLLWSAFALTAVVLAPVATLLSAAVPAADPALRSVAAPAADPALRSVATTVGVLAAAVQFLGLVRWPVLVPHLARAYEDPVARPAVDVSSAPSTATSAWRWASTSATG
jgi:hypothetical protein